MTPLKPHLIRALHEWIINNGYTPYLLVDATYDDVQVPSSYVSDGKIVLNINPNAIQDWLIDDDAISFSARFSGRPENLFVPINAVLATYAKENGKGMMFDEHFEDDMPPEPTDSNPVVSSKPKAKSNKPFLKIVK